MSPICRRTFGEFEETLPHHRVFDSEERETIYIGKDKYKGVMEINAETKQELKIIIRDEIRKMLSREIDTINNNDLVRSLSPIQKNPRSFEKLVELCKNKPKRFSSHKEYLKFVDEG